LTIRRRGEEWDFLTLGTTCTPRALFPGVARR